MKTRAMILLVIAVCILFFGLNSVAQGKTDNFIISYADASNTRGLTVSTTLNALIANVAPRFVVAYANESRYVPLVPIPAGLQTLITNVADRFVLAYANENHFESLGYPVDLIADDTPPTIISSEASSPTDDSLQIVWVTNEYTLGMVEYGLDSGVYTGTVVDDTYRTQHVITIDGLVAEETYYYRINSTDRSGNEDTSQEYSITVSTSNLLYIPMIRK